MKFTGLPEIQKSQACVAEMFNDGKSFGHEYVEMISGEKGRRSGEGGNVFFNVRLLIVLDFFKTMCLNKFFN